MRHAWLAVLIALALAFPKIAALLGQEFYVSFASRVLIWALLASSLNLLVGMGGMVSLGHAAFFGAGAYVVGIIAADLPQLSSALLAWPLAMAVNAALALLIGVVSLRTRGVYFIMITLAFAQMVLYIFVSIKGYGGDDGMTIARRSSLPGVNMADDTAFYYVVLALLGFSLHALGRLKASRFGRALMGIKDNEERMESMGYPTFQLKLASFVIAGSLAGLAGALMANQNGFVSPNMLHWDQSGTALVMVILGGLGSLWGGLAGAAVYMLLQEVLTAFTAHWQIALGLFLLAVVFFAPGGIAGLFSRKPR